MTRREQPAQGEPCPHCKDGRIFTDSTEPDCVTCDGTGRVAASHPEGGEPCTCNSPNCSKWHDSNVTKCTVAAPSEGMSADRRELKQLRDDIFTAITKYRDAHAALKVREATDKALDEAAMLYREHFYCAEYSDTSEAYLADLSKLKGKR